MTRSIKQIVVALVCFGAFSLPKSACAEALRVCATIPDLGSLAREIGGESVEVTTFVKGGEDPHFIEPKPSYVKALSRADLFIQVGLDLELGWVPPLLSAARNSGVRPGSPGYLDASSVIEPLQTTSGPVDRSMGDVHAEGNPHYLLDPLNGLKVAAAIRERLAGLLPAEKAQFDQRFDDFRRRLGEHLVGAALAEKYDAEKLAFLYEYGKLDDFLVKQGEKELLGGWLGKLASHFGTAVVTDHELWPYFARRFGLKVAGFLEPKPGVPPGTAHLQGLIEMMKQQRVAYILLSPYFPERYARFVSENTGARILPMAHQVASRQQTPDYLQMIAYNVDQVLTATESSHE